VGRRIQLPKFCVRCGLVPAEFKGDLCKPCLEPAYWEEVMHHSWDPGQVRVKHTFYIVKPDPPMRNRAEEPMGGKGFGGIEWKILYKDGRFVVTRNLWFGGDIPKEYWEALPDNAEFVKSSY
jgi:hypothetical protein